MCSMQDDEENKTRIGFCSEFGDKGQIQKWHFDSFVIKTSPSILHFYHCNMKAKICSILFCIFCCKLYVVCNVNMYPL